MGGHHADLIAPGLQLALDRDVEAGEGGGQALQVVDPAALGGQHLGQELVERVLSLAPQPTQQARAHRPARAVAHAEHTGVELERPTGARLHKQTCQEVRGAAPLHSLMGAIEQGAPEARRAALGQAIEALVSHVAERTAQQGPPTSDHRRGTG